MLTITDLFCGAGGSSTGAIDVPGVQVRVASNHWQLAVETHNTNHPDADHICADLSQIAPRYFPTTDILWASPECTNHSVAKGQKRQTGPDLFGDLLPDAAAERSRATMWDVPRFAEYHQYRAIIVENVVDAAKWIPFDAWLMAMTALGYQHRIVWLNSMHAQAHGDPAPQSRDRMYVVFWRKGDRAPDLEAHTRPWAICPDHGPVQAIQSWKRPDRKPWGRYRAQYVYRCPRVECRNAIIEPGWLPAASIIDWSNRGTRIGDRTRPLAAKTLARIRAGLERYGTSIIEAVGNQYDSADPKHPQHGRPGAYMRTWPVNDPLRTLHTTASKALLVPVEGRTGKDAQPATDPMRTQTTRNETGVLITLRGSNAPKATSEPLDTFAAAGTHHALIMRNNTARAGEGYLSTPVSEVMRTIATAGHQSLLIPAGGTWNDDARPVTDPLRARTTREAEGLLIPYRNRSRAISDREPLPTLTTVDPAAHVVTAADIDDCLFRMLEPSEIKRGMAFPSEYVILGNRREQVRMSGNAVTPPSARDLVWAVAESLGGVA